MRLFLTKHKRQTFLLGRETGVLLGFIILFISLSILSPFFLTVDNLLNVALQSATYILVAVGMLFTIVTGGIDLSVGSIAALAGVIMAISMKSGLSVGIAVLLGLLVGLICGFVNGITIAWAKLPPFIVTLATMSIIQGIALILTKGIPIYGFPYNFRWLGTGTIGIFPFAAVIALVITAIGAFILSNTKIGQYAMAIGDNEEAVRLCGINVVSYTAITYVISAFTASTASIIIMARLNTAEPLGATMLGLDAVAAVVMGGTSLSGGRGTILGTVLGALIMVVLRDGLNLLSVQPYYQQLAMGFVILVAVLLDKVRRRNK